MKVRLYPVSPDAWREAPAAVAQVVAKRMAEEPDALWVVVIGSADDTKWFTGRELVLNNLDDFKAVLEAMPDELVEEDRAWWAALASASEAVSAERKRKSLPPAHWDYDVVVAELQTAAHALLRRRRGE